MLGRLAAIERQIIKAGGMPGGGRRGGSRRGGSRLGGPSLVEALRQLLTDKTLGVTEAALAVKEAGYRSDSPNFRTMVNQSLLKKEVFKRVGRGRYTAK